MDKLTRVVPKQDSYFDEPIILPPNNMTVDETKRKGIYDANGQLFTRRVGFFRQTPDVTRSK